MIINNLDSMQMFKVLKNKTRQYFLKSILNKTVSRGMFYAKGRENIGDSMVPWLIKNISGEAIPFSNPRESNGPHLFSIGSILQYADTKSFIWGSGLISMESRPHSLPDNIFAVRGPLTNRRLIELGAKTTLIYGDPAIITPKYISSEVQGDLYRLGLIPHYVDKNKIKNTPLCNSKNTLICDVETSDIQKFVNQISSCEVVISSSLHGIILAESFGIPAIWATFGNDVVGAGFKFHDYYASTGRKVNPVSFYEIKENEFCKYIPLAPRNLQTLALDLLDSYPYEF